MAHAEAGDPTLGTGGGALGAVDRLVHRIEKLTALISGLRHLRADAARRRARAGPQVLRHADLRLHRHRRDHDGVPGVSRPRLHRAARRPHPHGAVRQLPEGALAGAVRAGRAWCWASPSSACSSSTAGTTPCGPTTSATPRIDAQMPLWPSKIIVPICARHAVRAPAGQPVGLPARLASTRARRSIGVAEVIDAEEQALREAAAAGAFEIRPRAALATGGRRR